MAYNVPSRVDYLGDRMGEINYELVSIIRGATVVSNVRASLGFTNQQEMMPSGEIINSRLQDFLVFSTEYTFGSATDVPEPGDKIQRASGEIYQVVSKQGGRYNSQEGPYVPTTGTKKRLRIHTVRTHL